MREGGREAGGRQEREAGGGRENWSKKLELAAPSTDSQTVREGGRPLPEHAPPWKEMLCSHSLTLEMKMTCER